MDYCIGAAGSSLGLTRDAFVRRSTLYLMDTNMQFTALIVYLPYKASSSCLNSMSPFWRVSRASLSFLFALLPLCPLIQESSILLLWDRLGIVFPDLVLDILPYP
jgi:hypothetical protein